MNIGRNSAVFNHIFDQIFVNFDKIFLSILLTFVKIVNFSVIDLISKDRRGLLNCSTRVFWLEFMLSFSKSRFFFFEKKLFFLSQLALKLQEVATLNLRPYFS